MDNYVSDLARFYPNVLNVGFDRISHPLALSWYLILFIDEVDNVRRDKDNFMTFLVRRLPQKIPAKLIIVFVSNRLDWPELDIYSLLRSRVLSRGRYRTKNQVLGNTKGL